MFELLLIVILLPVALALGGALLFATMFLWNYVVAIALWVAALAIFVYGQIAQQNMFWWAFFVFLVGCFFWAFNTRDKTQTLN